MTKKQLKDMLEVCLYWQNNLRLRDWNITYRFLTDKEFEKEQAEEEDGELDALGQCSADVLTKEAIITVRESKSSQYKAGTKNNFELTVIHELVHIHFSGMPADLIVLEEQSVECIAQLLLKLKEGKK